MKTITIKCIIFALSGILSTSALADGKLNLKLPEDNQAKASTAKKKKKKSERKWGLSGTFSAKSSIKNTDDGALNASVTWKPDAKNYWYIKVGSKYDLHADEDPLTFSYGMGYDDWHTGTWTFQINHWGGIKPGDGLDTENAIGSIGYKFDSKFLKENKLSSAMTLAKQLGGNSDFKISTSLQWAPKQYWFLKGIVVTPLNGDDPVWNYLFGYDDWHPNTWGFELSNYDSNPLFETNFMKSSKLAITYKWKL